MDADEIRLAECIFKAHIFDPLFVGCEGMVMAEVHDLLNGGSKFLVLTASLVAENVHVKADAFFDHRLADTAHSDNGDGFAGHLIAKERQRGMPRVPLVFTGHALLAKGVAPMPPA